MCGKDVYAVRPVDVPVGSPPRVRERQFFDTDSNFNLGITPACAGKTDSNCIKVLEGKDHPRVCGKDLSARSFSARA